MNACRFVLVILVVAGGTLGLPRVLAGGQFPGAVQASTALHNAPDNRSSQERPADVSKMPTPDKEALAENAKELRNRVDRLCRLASDLRSDLDNTDAAKVFSVGLTRKAQEIEKLAKDIKARAKG